MSKKLTKPKSLFKLATNPKDAFAMGLRMSGKDGGKAPGPTARDRSDIADIEAEKRSGVLRFGKSLRSKGSILGSNSPFTSSLLGGRPGGI